MSGIGHNNGPSMERGVAWRRHSWSKARADLIPNLPIEILRRRVKRAKELGLPYRTYASVRASTGRDVIGFLFSNNALRILRDGAHPPQDRIDSLRAIKAGRGALVHLPVSPGSVAEHLGHHGIDLDFASRAPRFDAPWSDLAAAVSIPLQNAGWPRDGVLVVGDTTHERLWSEAGRLAGFLPSDRYFAAAERGNS